MKFAGSKIEKKNETWLVFERKSADEGLEHVSLLVRPIESYDRFHELVKTPRPPVRHYPGGATKDDTTDPEYLKLKSEHYAKFNAWMVIESIRHTPQLEFEKVDVNDPDTWLAVDEELDELLYSHEQARVLEEINKMNSVTDESLVRARERFLSLEAAKPRADSSSPTPDQAST